MHQKNTKFIAILDRVWDGTQTESDVHYLNSTFVRAPSQQNSIPYLFYTNQDKKNHNQLL